MTARDCGTAIAFYFLPTATGFSAKCITVPNSNVGHLQRSVVPPTCTAILMITRMLGKKIVYEMSFHVSFQNHTAGTIVLWSLVLKLFIMNVIERGVFY